MILRLLCAPLSLTSYLTCRVISPLAPLSSSPPCTRHLPLLPPLLPLLRSLARLRLPSPLTCRLPTSLVSSLRLPLPRCLSLFLRLLILPLPSLLLLAFAPLLLPPLWGRVLLLWYQGWVWVSHLLLGSPLTRLTRLLLRFSAPSHAPAPASAAWPPAYPPDHFAHSPHGAAVDPYRDDDDDRFPGDVHDPLDPSAPPLALESARSEYRRMIDYICGLFPQVVGVPPSAPPPRPLFESFFAPAAQATPSVQLNWFDHVRTSLLEADSRVASLLSSGRPECLVVPQRLPTYEVKGDCALGHAVPVNESLLSHFECPLRPNLQLGITIRDAMALEASSHSQSEALLCHVGPFRVVGLRAPAGFYSRRSCSLQPACDSSFQEPCPSGSGISLSYSLLMSPPPRVLLVSPP